MSWMLFCSVIILWFSIAPYSVRIAWGTDGYQEVMNRGTLRHLGVPYARFVTGSGDGLDVELVQLFADHLGVRYEYVQTSWKNVIADLIGNEVILHTQGLSVGSRVPVRGDLIANGFTLLPWREKVVAYSIPTFPSGVWLMARADCHLRPIVPSGNSEQDIQSTVATLNGYDVLAIEGGCLDPALNRLQDSGVHVRLMPVTMNLNELIPAVLNNQAHGTLIDVPDALVAIQKWPGKIKVIGPLSIDQQMGVAFAKSSLTLRDQFNAFFIQCVKKGVYQQLLKKYYPSIFAYYPQFFKKLEASAQGQ